MESNTFNKSWGAEYAPDGTVRFRLWADGQNSVTLRLAGNDHVMESSGNGWFIWQENHVAPGTPYQYLLADGTLVPDPASRAQQSTVHGPSRLGL